MIIYAVTKKYLIDVPIDKIGKFEQDLYVIADNKYPQIGKAIRETKVLDEESEKLLQEAIKECKNNL